MIDHKKEFEKIVKKLNNNSLQMITELINCIRKEERELARKEEAQRIEKNVLAALKRFAAPSTHRRGI
jgi:hypothetical protein